MRWPAKPCQRRFKSDSGLKMELVLVLAFFIFVVVLTTLSNRPRRTESNPIYHKKFWREVREDDDYYPGPMPM